jgi:hypothetical protein
MKREQRHTSNTRRLSGMALPALALLATGELPARAQCITHAAQVAELVANDPGTDDYFGVGADIEGDWAVVGAYYDNGAGTNSGAVYVFQRAGNNWTQYAKLYGSSTGTSDHAGYEVSISGDVILFGSYHDDPGASSAGSAYAFVNDNGTWTEISRLTATIGGASNAGTNDHFGWSVAIDGDWAVVGSFRDDVLYNGTPYADAGSAYIFWRDRKGTSAVGDDTFEPLHQLTAFVPYWSDEFGYDVSISGDRIVVGAPLRNSLQSGDAGAAYVFLRDDRGTPSNLSDDVWAPDTELQVPNGAASDYVGRSVAIDGDRILLGADGVNHSGLSDAGAAYTFIWDSFGSYWYLESQMLCSIPTASAYFGWEVALDGNRAAIGACGDDVAGTNSGAVYVWENCSGSWQERVRVLGQDSRAGDQLGYTVALDGNQVLGGAYAHDHICSNQGSAFIHVLSSASFAPFCFGDGQGTPCPCGNDSPAGLGHGCVNSTGDGATLAAMGTDSVSTDDLEMVATGVVPSSPILLFAGNNAVNNGLGIIFGDGLRCAGGQVQRLGVRIPSNAGVAFWGPGIVAQGGWSAGDRVYFQGWYRDMFGGPCGFQFNTTNGLEVTFTQ